MKEHITLKQAEMLLKRYSNDPKSLDGVLSHSRTVRDIAVRVAAKVDDVDMDFIRSASLLHDIGRFSCPPGSKASIRHGLVGKEILENEGLPEHGMVALRHIGIGITKEDVRAQGLDLPERDMVPQTREEMIITYADNLVDGDMEMDEAWAVEDFTRSLGREYGIRMIRFNKRIHKLIKP